MTAPSLDPSATAVEELPTPCVVVDLDQLEPNVARMAEQVAGGARLRPHTKTHKTAEVARMQLDHGAAGITVAKLGEAEVMADAGFDDILVANEVVGAGKLERLTDLARRIAVRTCVDDAGAAHRLSEAAVAAGTRVRVLVDVDSGLGRAGVPPERAVELGDDVARLPGLDLAGVFTYAGNRGHGPHTEQRRRAAVAEAEVALGVARALRQRGHEAPEVSVGGTAAAPFAAHVPGVTEVRPGTYVFGDMNSVRMGLLSLDDCALRVQATVVSRPARDRAVLDAGSKALTSDGAVGGEGHGTIPERPAARIARLWEEHAVVELGAGDRDLAVGDVVGVIPNHVCPVVNLADRWYGVRGGRVERVCEVIGRGRVA